MRSITFVCVLVLALTGATKVCAEEHKKPAKTAKAGDTKKHLLEVGKTKQVVKTVPEKVDAACHHDAHFGHDGIKALYSVGKDLWWVEVTEDGKDFLLEFNSNGELQAIAWEHDGSLVILIEGEDGYLWAVDDEGNAVVFKP